jgi:thiosulfate reductase/polysulfide reductase chain A
MSREELTFPTPSGKIEIESAILKQAGLSSLPPYEAKATPTDDRFLLLIGRTATLTHGQSYNNPILNAITPEQVLWIHPDRARPLGIDDGDTVEIRGVVGAGSPRPYVGRIKAKVTPWIHPEAVFMLHGFGATVPLATRAFGRGVADQRLQQGKLYDFDPAGGGCALTETVVQIQPAAAEGGAL